MHEASGCFRKVNQSGGSIPPSKSVEWAEEISLDLDMVSAICPNCHILLVEANTPSSKDLAAAVNEAVELGRPRSATATAPRWAQNRRSCPPTTIPASRSRSPPATKATAWKFPPTIPT